MAFFKDRNLWKTVDIITVSIFSILCFTLLNNIFKSFFHFFITENLDSAEKMHFSV